MLAGVVLSTEDSTGTPGGTDAGEDIDPIGTDPTSVAALVMAGSHTWQPSVQDSPWDALHAQRARLSGAMADAASAPPDPAPRPLTEWAAWARSGDVVSAIARPGGAARVEGTTAIVPVTLTQTVQHTSGAATPYSSYTATVTLTDTGGTWSVSNYRLASAR